MNNKVLTYCINQDMVSYKDYIEESSYVDKYYEISNPYAVPCIAIPDGTINIQCIWKDSKYNIVVAGCLNKGSVSALSDVDMCFGVRLKTDMIPDFLKGRMEEIISSRIPIEEYIDIPEDLYCLQKDMSFSEKIVNMKKTLLGIRFESHGELVSYIISKLIASRGSLNIEQLIESTGYCHRYVDSVFKNTTGLSIKKYAGILRMQNGIRYILENRDDDVYSKLQYYDQSHFIHDFKNFTTYTPSKFQKLFDSKCIKMV